MRTIQTSSDFSANKQQEKSINMDIADPNGSVDGEILRQFIDDGLQPVEALMLIIKERALELEDTFPTEEGAENADNEDNEDNEEDEDEEISEDEEIEENQLNEENEEIDSWENVSLFSFDSEKRCRSLSPGTKQHINKLKEKLLKKGKLSPSDIKEKC